MKCKKRFLSAALAGIFSLSMANVKADNNDGWNKFLVTSLTVLGIASIIGGIYAWFKYDAKKEQEKELARRQNALISYEYSNENKIIIRDLLSVIPVSSEGNSCFDKLLKLNSLEEFKRWGNIDIANSDFSLYYLQRILNVLTNYSVFCQSLEYRVETESRIQAGKEVGKNISTHHTVTAFNY